MQKGCLSSLGTSPAGVKHRSGCYISRLPQSATQCCESASVRVSNSTESSVTRRTGVLGFGAVLVGDLCLRSAASSAVDQSAKKAIEVCPSLEQSKAYQIATYIMDVQKACLPHVVSVWAPASHAPCKARTRPVQSLLWATGQSPSFQGNAGREQEVVCSKRLQSDAGVG